MMRGNNNSTGIINGFDFLVAIHTWIAVAREQ